MILKRYIPDNSIAIGREGVDGIVYKYLNSNGQLCIIGYKGRANKPRFIFRFPNEEKRDNYIEQFFNSIELKENNKIVWRNEKKEKALQFAERLNVGTVLYCSWGYSMTIVDFYQIVEKKGCYVYLKALKAKTVSGSDGYGRISPLPNEFANNEILKKKINADYVKIKHGQYAYIDNSDSHDFNYND